MRPDLDEAALRDERLTRGRIGRPEAHDLRLARRELRPQVIPQRGAEAHASQRGIDGEAKEVAARVVAARLLTDLTEPERRVLFVHNDDT